MTLLNSVLDHWSVRFSSVISDWQQPYGHKQKKIFPSTCFLRLKKLRYQGLNLGSYACKACALRCKPFLRLRHKFFLDN